MCSNKDITIQNMRCETYSTERNPSEELLENVLFSIFLNHDTLGSGNVVNRIIIENNRDQFQYEKYYHPPNPCTYRR